MSLAEGYEYDLFVSYRRTDNVKNWVHRHFVPILKASLVEELGREPMIFLDAGIETGTRWPDRLASALHRSHLLLAIWSPPYFASPWCMAEWRTFQRREDALGLERDDPRSLVYPIRYADGDKFPSDAQNVQQETNFKKYKYPDDQFRKSPLYLPFRNRVEELAIRLAGRLDDPPPWCPDWPIERPPPPPTSPTSLPSMWRAR